MLVWALLVTVLLVSDVAGTHYSLELERTPRHLEKRELSQGPCDESWFHFPPLNSCYRFYNDTKTWIEAEDFCNQNSCYRHLASVNSSNDNDFISKVITAVDNSRSWAWIGLSDYCKEGNFTWIDGTPYSYENWDNNQPDDAKNNEDCVHIHHSSSSKWNDYPCNKKLGFVCSYKLQCT